MVRKVGKMTLTFNSHKYQELLIRYQPKIIRTEAENEKALAIVEELMHRSNRSPEENERNFIDLVGVGFPHPLTIRDMPTAR
jgi:hypothetical protein